MRKIISGAALMFFGLFLYLAMHMKAVDLLPTIISWPTEKGKFWEALHESNGLTPTYVGIAFCVIGIILLLMGCFEQEMKRVMAKRKSSSNLEG